AAVAVEVEAAVEAVEAPIIRQVVPELREKPFWDIFYCPFSCFLLRYFFIFGSPDGPAGPKN
ncbi:MAG: hypothetical protein J6Q24_00935, partial [Clostridia bacterium]|nr:hypothetical protein [Clostridia bacterium]